MYRTYQNAFVFSYSLHIKEMYDMRPTVFRIGNGPKIIETFSCSLKGHPTHPASAHVLLFANSRRRSALFDCSCILNFRCHNHNGHPSNPNVLRQTMPSNLLVWEGGQISQQATKGCMKDHLEPKWPHSRWSFLPNFKFTAFHVW